ncbi:MAG: MFS transporter, partial [Verrucomicrobiae bacterium]|nr:MFS transporter [Verrucomicrobiae bacterium]
MSPPNGPQPPPSGMRWVICGLLFAATAINYMDRQILGILAPTLEREIGWDEIAYGHIVTAFQAAYAIGLLGFGRVLDTWGTRVGYSVSVACWSLAALAHALASSTLGFGAARFALGLGEAGNFPAAVKAVGEWFPPRERALANGIFNSGANVGAILAPALVPWMVSAWGWRAAFIALGATGFAWLALWWWLYRTPPDDARGAGQETPEPSAPTPWRRLLAHRQTWACIIPFALSAPVWWFYLYWLPKFLTSRHGLELAALGPPLIVVYTMTCAGSVAGGWLSSALLRRGHSTNVSRKVAMLACAACVLPVCLAPIVPGLWTATLLIGIAAAAHQGWAANLFAVVADLFPKRAVASAVALGVMAGSLSSMAFSQAAGWILQTSGSYWPLFVFAATAYLAALALMHALSP